MRIALRPDHRSLARIIKLRYGAVVGILSHSRRFGEVVEETLHTYNHGITLGEVKTFDQVTDMEQWLRDKDAVLVPRGYEKYCTGQSAEALQRFSEQKKRITCGYEMDEGSFLYLEERIRRAREEKPI